MNPIAQRLNEASVMLEGTRHPEIAEMLRIGAEEIQRLQSRVDAGIESVWRGRRFYFKVLKNPPNTPLAIVFNSILDDLGQTNEQGNAMHARFYPPDVPASSASGGPNGT